YRSGARAAPAEAGNDGVPGALRRVSNGRLSSDGLPQPVSRAFRSASPVAACADNFTLLDHCREQPYGAHEHQSADLGRPLAPYMVELQNGHVRFTAVHAGVPAQIVNQVPPGPLPIGRSSLSVIILVC